MKANQRTSVAFRYARYILILSAIFLINSFNAAASQLDIVGPAGSQQFGTATIALPNGNIVITDPLFDLPGPITDVGAVYLYNGKTGALISTITGSTASDSIGGTTAANIVVLANGNYLIRSANWDNGAVADAGAVTFCGCGTTGCSGVVSAANSLVGSTATDNVGSFGATILTNGNYVVRSQNWDNGAATNVGAITFCNGTTGCVGAVTPANSLVGSTAADVIGNVGVEVLPNNNYLVRSSSWDNGAATSAGAVSFCSGTTGCVGPGFSGKFFGRFDCQVERTRSRNPTQQRQLHRNCFNLGQRRNGKCRSGNFLQRHNGLFGRYFGGKFAYRFVLE